MQQPGENSDDDAFSGWNCSETFSAADSRENILRTNWARIGPNRRTPLEPAPLSGFPMPDRKRREVSRDIVGIERRAGEGADRIGAFAGLPIAPERCDIEVGAEYTRRGLQRLRAVGGLSPAHHLCVEPGGLHRLRPLRAFPSDQQIAAALAHGAVRRDLQPAIERTLDDLGVNADAVGLRKNSGGLGTGLRLLNECGCTRG